ncbi:hypothetical protein ABT026_16245 [Streptomyces sp. NPDC002734]|uniref:hypothetical protein n=1 Tax=Streptomyces sp. NPDC002734 TaxID=3154426 RepID=UPI00332377E4
MSYPNPQHQPPQWQQQPTPQGAAQQPAPQWQAAPPQWQPAPPQWQQPPPVVINNNVSAMASAVAYGGMRRRRQSVAAHFWLFLFTAGIGNVLYAMHISRWNRIRGL